MSAKALVASLLLCHAACQLGQGSGAFDKDPSATSPDGTTQGTTGSTQQGGTGGTGTTGTAGTSAAPVTVRYLGRVNETSKTLTWSGTGVEAGFAGSGGTATFAATGSATSVIGVSVDGGAMTKAEITGTVQVPFSASGSGNHVVRFLKLSEAELGSVTFGGLTLSGGKAASFTPPSRRIEFIGDSITVGYGIEGNAPCTNNARMENVAKSWAYLTGQSLQADVSVIAWSGHGILRNGVSVNDTVLMPAIWPRQGASDATTKYDFASAPQPDAVVINLGTNDYTYLTYSAGQASPGRAQLDQTAFVAAYKAFVQQVRAAYPNALIVLSTSPMLTDNYPTTTEKQWSSLGDNIAAVISALGDSNMASLSVPTQDTTSTGCDGHPDAGEQQAMAALLTPLLKQKLGW
jgi:lysophospholipase L1-like esterase